MQTRNEGIKVGGVGPGDLYIWSEELRERKQSMITSGFLPKFLEKMELPLHLGEMPVLGGRSLFCF